MSEKAISGKSPIESGFIITIFLCIVTILGAIGSVGIMLWKGGAREAEINLKLDTLITGQNEMRQVASSVSVSLANLESRVTRIETVGSVPLTARIVILEQATQQHEKEDIVFRNELNDLIKTFRLHATKLDPAALVFPPSGGKKEGETW